MVNNVIGVVNYVIAARPSLLNFMIADIRQGQSLKLRLRRPGGDPRLDRIPGSVVVGGGTWLSEPCHLLCRRPDVESGLREEAERLGGKRQMGRDVAPTARWPGNSLTRGQI